MVTIRWMVSLFSVMVGLIGTVWFLQSCVVGGDSGGFPDGFYRPTDGSSVSTDTIGGQEDDGKRDASANVSENWSGEEVGEPASGETQQPHVAEDPENPGMEERQEQPWQGEGVAEKQPQDEGVSCGKAGMEVDAQTPCCTNLKRAAWAQLPECKVIPDRWICVDCGDGRCDTRNGENTCNCRVDCAANLECSQDSDCGKPSCRDSGTSCVTTTPTCRTGRCVTQSQTQVLMRCMGGTTCEKRCAKAADCGIASCRNQGNDCEQTTPTCTNGNCGQNNQTQAWMECNVTTNQCEMKACKAVSDCPKPQCKQNGTTCEGTMMYCFTQRCRAIPVSQKDRICNTTTGLCEIPKSCKTATDCGKNSCQLSGSLCVQTTVLCSNSLCQTQVREAGYATCQTATGYCQGQSCTQTSACGKAFCVNAGSDCKEVIPACAYNIICQSAIRTVKNATCQTSTGKCVLQKPCQQNSDCGEAQCLWDNRSCLNLDSVCTMGTCQVQSKSASGFCNVQTGRCQ